MNKKNIIGIDIGGSYIKAGLVKKNKILKKVIYKTPKKKKEIINLILKIINELKDKNTISVGIGCPTTFKDEKISEAHNIDLENINLKKIVENKTNLKINIGNDADCFVFAEAILGEGKESNYVAGITLGTGIGGGLVINKQIYVGRGNAFEFGHTLIDTKTVEYYIGKKGIFREIKKRGIKAKTPFDLYILAKEGNKKSILFWKWYGSILGKAIVNMIQTVDPEIIIIGGKISDSWSFFEKEMNITIKKYVSLSPCKIIKSKLNEPGIVGASLLSL